LNLFRSIIPPLGGMDFSPILAFFALNLAGGFLRAIPY
jgi:YggT family protein